MGRGSKTPELDAAREAGEVLLVTWLIAVCKTEVEAERWLGRLRAVFAMSADFEPELPPEARERATRRAALTAALAWREGRPYPSTGR